MIFRKRGWLFPAVALLLIVAVLAACQQTPEVVEVTRVVTETVEIEGEAVEVTRIVTETEEVEVTRVVEVAEPGEETGGQETAAPADRTGAWVDTIVVVDEPNADAAVSRLAAGDLDVYAFTIASPETASAIADAGLEVARSFGSYNELTFNTAQCADEQFNPFNVPAVREAMNWAIDRDFIVNEIYGGLAVPRYTPVSGASADAARFAPTIRQLEAEYAYNIDQARETIAAAMEEAGAELVDDVWQVNGAPVELIFLIRTEDERQQIGDYFAGQLEDLGFQVVRQYGTSSELSPIWTGSDPAECQFHIYTGGWISTAIPRDSGENFEFFYTPAGLPFPLWQAYTPTEEFQTLATRLANNDFQSMEERAELFQQALPLSLQDSTRIWLIDRVSVAPHRADIEVASDLFGSIAGTSLWPMTIKRVGEDGGSINYASQGILTEPWNPVAGSNWIYDQALIDATDDHGVIADPATGLNWPQRIESATVTVQEELPVTKTLDWVELEFAPTIEVPDDALVDWDATNQVWLTASEVYTETETAAMRSVVTYPADLYDTVSWHDGSTFSAADIMMMMILQFDRAKEDSAIFDAAYVPDFESFTSAFKGWRITSVDPLTVEYYTDNWQLDAELGVAPLWPTGVFAYPFGPGAWHNVFLGVLAEQNDLAVFSDAKAEEVGVEQLNYIAGPTLETMTQMLDQASGAPTEEGAEAGPPVIPYAPTMSEYITEEEAAARYANLQEWFRVRGHYWIGTGPFFLQRAFPVESTVILERFPEFPDAADKWERFAEPAIPVVEVEGPASVVAGQPATFDVFVDYQGEPYSLDDIQEVQFLLFNAEGELVEIGQAEAVEDGLYQIGLDEALTGELPAGANRVEAIVTSRLVALPSLASFDFVTTTE